MNEVQGTVSEFATREEELLARWASLDIFAKQIAATAGGEPFTYYDGPPFATGLPHFGHLLPTGLKDAVPRYMSMRGRSVARQWGWDCHGLPIEQKVEAKVGKGKILISGIDLTTDLDKRPEAQQLLFSLKKYMAGEKFNPQIELEATTLTRLY